MSLNWKLPGKELTVTTLWLQIEALDIPPSYISNAETQSDLKSIFQVKVTYWVVQVTFRRSHSVSGFVFSCPLVRIVLSIDSDTVTYPLVTLVMPRLEINFPSGGDLLSGTSHISKISFCFWSLILLPSCAHCIDSDTVTYPLVTLVTPRLRVTWSQFSKWTWPV